LGQLADVSTTFPGIVYGSTGRALAPDRPDLTQVLIDAAPVRRLIIADDEALDAEACEQPGRTWLLNIGARWEDVPAFERHAALSMLRCGYAVLLLAAESEDEASVREGLLYLLGEDRTPNGRFGHA
jgi:hypothetical protein